MQPGETITPGSQNSEQNKIDPQPPVSSAPVTVATQTVQEVTPQSPQQTYSDSDQPPTMQPVSNWQFSESNQPGDYEQVSPVSWTASEFVSHGKGRSWFVAFGLVILITCIAFYFLLKDLVTPIVIAVAGFIFLYYSRRQPRTLQYSVDAQGIHIDQKLYPFEYFKSFDIAQEGSFPAIHLASLKRFMPPLTIFYDVSMEEPIVNIISNYLPHQEYKPDAIDNIARRIRF